MWRVNVVKFKGDEIVRYIDCDSERDAEKASHDVNCTIDHEEYYTEYGKVRGENNATN